jgi:hypothetical protein
LVISADAIDWIEHVLSTRPSRKHTNPDALAATSHGHRAKCVTKIREQRPKPDLHKHQAKPREQRQATQPAECSKEDQTENVHSASLSHGYPNSIRSFSRRIEANCIAVVVGVEHFAA